nr:hypothetical protein [Actinomycetota bacterium]
MEVVVPPLHHQVVTARLHVAEDAASLADAAAELELRLGRVESLYEQTPAGLGVTLAWGLPYFARYVPGQAPVHLPFDRRAGKDALLDAIRFPSDPDELILEANDVAVLLRSDRLDAVAEGARVLFPEDDSIFAVTSIRKGFAGGGFAGGQSLPKQMATAAGVPGAELIPDTAELFLGFTSTQRATLGPSRIANFETLGFVDVRDGYFGGGTHMHLSHIFEDLEAWYLNFDFRERVDTTFHPGLDVRSGAQTVAQREPVPTREVEAVFRRAGRIGHGAAIQATSRLEEDVIGPDETLYTRGTAVPQRADFNTLDNPFFWTSTPERDGMAEGAAAGVHFLTFNPSSDDFRRNRLAMDGVLPDGRRLELEPR